MSFRSSCALPRIRVSFYVLGQPGPNGTRKGLAVANYFAPGDKVVTEWGGGTVIGGVRGTTIKLDSGEVINIAHGTPGARRLREANPKPVQA